MSEGPAQDRHVAVQDDDRPVRVLEDLEDHLDRGKRMLGGIHLETKAIRKTPRGSVEFNPGGSLGCFARTLDDNQIVALTNHHILHEEVVDEPIENGVKVVKKRIKRKARHPLASKSSPCCDFLCDPTVGRIYDSILSAKVDGAIIALDPGKRYENAVKGIGPIGPPNPLNPDDPAIAAQVQAASIVVQKRGIRSHYTRGYVTNLKAQATDEDNRVFTPIMEIAPAPPFRAFVLKGDSGSILLDVNKRPVGLLFLGGGDPSSTTTGFHTANACRIEFVASELNIQLLFSTGGGGEPGERVVPPANHPEQSPRAGDREEVDLAEEGRRFETAYADAFEALVATARGRECLEAFRRNQDEILTLARRNRRVAATWRRSRGPRIANELAACLRDRRRCVVDRVEGVPVEQAIEKVLDVFERYGSAQLRDDIAANRALLGRLRGMSFDLLMQELLG